MFFNPFILLAFVSVLFVFGLPLAPVTAQQSDDPAAERWSGPLVCRGQVEGEIAFDLVRDGPVISGRFALTQSGAGAPVLEFNLRAREIEFDPNALILGPSERRALESATRDGGVATGLLLALDAWITRPDGFDAGRFTAIDIVAGQSMDLITGLCRNDPNALIRLVRTDAADTDDAVPGGDAVALARPQDEGPPVQTGWEGQWEGAIRCAVGGREIPVTLTLLEDFPGLVGLVRTQAEWAAVYNAYSVFAAQVDDAGTLRETAVIRATNTGTTPRVTEGRLEGDTLSLTMAAVMEGRGNSQCTSATLRRTGPAPAPTPQMMEQIAGAWYGYGYGNPQDTLISRDMAGGGNLPLNSLPAHALMHVDVIAGESPHALFRVTGAMGRPPAERNRLALMMRPLQIADGPVIFVATRQRLGTGRFDRASPEAEQSSWVRRPLAVVFEVPEMAGADQAVMMRVRTDTLFGHHSEWRYLLTALSDEQRAVMDTGARPPYALAPAFVGTLADAPSGEAQCGVLEEWVKAHVSPEPSGRSVDAQFEQYLPLFLDSAMEPVFGLPIAFMAGSELMSISSLINVCVIIPGHPSLQSHSRVIYGLWRGGNSLNRIVADVATRSAGMDWASEALGQIEAIDPSAAEAEAALTAFEAELQSRRQDLTVDQLAGMRAMIEARRQDVVLIALDRDLAALEQGAPPPGARTEMGRLDLNALSALYSRVSAAEAMPSAAFDGSAARAIMGPVYEAAAADLLANDPALQWRPNGPPDLAALQASLAYINTLAFHTRNFPAEFAPANFASLSREAQSQRGQWLEDPSVMAVLAPVLAGRAATATTEAQLTQAVLDWVTEAEVARVGLTAPFRDQITRNRQEAEIATIDIRDISVTNPPGAPSAREIALAIKAQLDGFNAENDAALQQCQQGQMSNLDPLGALRCAQLATAEASGGMRFRLLRVTKIGCARPQAITGYLCDFSYGISSNNMFLQGFIGDVLGAGEVIRGQFIQTSQGWMFNRFP